MANLTRIKVKSAPPTRVPPRTKVLLVKPSTARPAHRIEPRDKTATRLAMGVIVAVGIVGLVWLMGFLGYRLGFAPLVRVRDLMAEPSGGLATGTIMLISMPRVIFHAGMSQTVGFMLAFLLIAIPGAGLAAVRPYPKGGPRIPTVVVVFSITGAILSAINGIGMIWWTVSSYRNGMVVELPFLASDGEQWLTNLETVSGLDALATVAAACWVVLVMRLPIPVWLKALTSSFALFTLVVVMVAMSMSNATVAQVTASRSVYLADEDSLDACLLIGSTRNHFAAIRLQKGVMQLDPNQRLDDQNAIIVQLVDRPSSLTVIGSQSIIDFLNAGAGSSR